MWFDPRDGAARLIVSNENICNLFDKIHNYIPYLSTLIMKEIFLHFVLLLVYIWINSYHHSRKCHKGFDIKGTYNILYSSTLVH